MATFLADATNEQIGIFIFAGAVVTGFITTLISVASNFATRREVEERRRRVPRAPAAQRRLARGERPVRGMQEREPAQAGHRGTERRAVRGRDVGQQLRRGVGPLEEVEDAGRAGVGLHRGPRGHVVEEEAPILPVAHDVRRGLQPGGGGRGYSSGSTMMVIFPRGRAPAKACMPETMSTSPAGAST